MDIDNTPRLSPSTGYLRICGVVPPVVVGDVAANAAGIAACFKSVTPKPDVAVFPELCMTGYTCGDMLHNEALLAAAERGIERLAGDSGLHGSLLVVGAPLRWHGRLFNCAVAICNGAVAGVVPKSFIPNYGEFYERRWMSSGLDVPPGAMIELCGSSVPFGTDVLLRGGGAVIAIDVCEDVWSPVPPSAIAAANGANVVLNLSATNEVTGKHDALTQLLLHHSARTDTAYIYSSAGFGESTTDLVFDGKAYIACSGRELAATRRFDPARLVPQHKGSFAIADIDLAAINYRRMRNTTLGDSARAVRKNFRYVDVPLTPRTDYTKSLTPEPPTPFVPAGDKQRDKACSEAFVMQQYGLMRRLQATAGTKLVLGLSGGLDSTLAMLVAAEAFKRLGLDIKGLHCITMPGMGTTKRTKSNAVKLMEALGVTAREIDIVPAVEQHFRDIGQDPAVHDVTFENSQARERTQILMDYANRIGAMVLGTGDMSELALGWATYNGDHMSMYNVNASIPKTLVKAIVRWYADNEAAPQVAELLNDVLDTPISPELTPHGENDEIKQKTEDAIGPYRLHDFFLYHLTAGGASPERLLGMATRTFEGEFEPHVVEHWLEVFLKRFFTQQFKRSCVPDGPKVTPVSLSPRGDWRMPSDMARLKLSKGPKS